MSSLARSLIIGTLSVYCCEPRVAQAFQPPPVTVQIYIACPHNEKILTCCHSLIWLVAPVILLFICHPGNVNVGGKHSSSSSSSLLLSGAGAAQTYHIWKTSLRAGMNVFIANGVSLALVSSASIHKKPTFDSFSRCRMCSCVGVMYSKPFHFDFTA